MKNLFHLPPTSFQSTVCELSVLFHDRRNSTRITWRALFQCSLSLSPTKTGKTHTETFRTGAEVNKDVENKKGKEKEINKTKGRIEKEKKETRQVVDKGGVVEIKKRPLYLNEAKEKRKTEK